MKVIEVPQDLKYYKGTKVMDINYAIDEKGCYKAVMSSGWEVKNDALDFALDDIKDQCKNILESVKRDEASPLEYYAAKNLMSIKLLSSYTGFSKRIIRKHFKPSVFRKLDKETLSIYADTLRISVEELKHIPE